MELDQQQNSIIPLYSPIVFSLKVLLHGQT